MILKTIEQGQSKTVHIMKSQKGWKKQVVEED